MFVLSSVSSISFRLKIGYANVEQILKKYIKEYICQDDKKLCFNLKMYLSILKFLMNGIDSSNLQFQIVTLNE